MNIAIIDADLIERKNHRFPNLACMKLSSYYKSLNHNVILKTNYENLNFYDKVFISKVFTDTPINKDILNLPNVEYGGTGFYYDKSPLLPYEIEHCMPDYHLYDEWVNKQIQKGRKRKEFEYYLDYSIGFTTRGCFRQCSFCVNKNYTKVKLHSPIKEFYDPSRKYICLLDDNILGYNKWGNIINQLKETNKPFQYKQGLDIRLLTEKRAKRLSESKYKGDYIFAFDDIDDEELIISKLQLWKKYCTTTAQITKLYVLCGFDRNNKYDYNFWIQDLKNTFERIKILMKYGCLPYIMRHENYKNSPYYGTYINLARWCNQPNFFKKTSYRKFCEMNQERTKTKECSAMKYLKELEEKHPEIAQKYFDLKFENFKEFTIKK